MISRTLPLACLFIVFTACTADDPLSAATDTSTSSATGTIETDTSSGSTGGTTGETESESSGESSGSSSTGGGSGVLCDDDDPDQVRPNGWGLESHCKGVDPDYDRLFDDSVVQRIDVTISADDFAAMQGDLADLLGDGDWDRDPIYVPSTVEYGDLTWWQVGVRYKGNSSLHAAGSMGIGKLALRLDFDEFEDDNPELHNQRFYGFKKMTFSNGFKDDSLMRDKLGGDIFRAAGVPVARSAFARVYVDVSDGAGPQYWGLYTMIEDPSNKMLDSQFEDDGGNLYKPDGDGARLATFVEGDMIKKTNEDDADYTDVQTLISVLNNGDGEGWRSELEAIFDVYGFLTLLAVNQSIVNWDSYGWMTHNYYLYADPTDARIKWIPWDLNESLAIQGMGGMGGMGGGKGSSSSVLLGEISAQWPMIRRLLDDEVYFAAYKQALLDLQDGAFALESTVELAHTYHDLIAPYVVGPEGERAGYTFLANDAAFESSIEGGKNAIADHIADRHAAVDEAL